MRCERCQKEFSLEEYKPIDNRFFCHSCADYYKRLMTEIREHNKKLLDKFWGKT